MPETITSDDDNVRILIAAWTSMVACFPGNAIIAADGVTSIMANTPFAFFNMVVIDRPCADSEDLRRLLGIARARADACPHPKLLAISTNWLPPGYQAVLDAERIRPAIAMTGMAADRLLPPRRPLPALSCRRVDDVASATQIAVINAHAYGMPEADVASISNMNIWVPSNIGIIGAADGRDVATTAAALVGDIIYIALVATEPDSHRRGYAEAVMRTAVDMAVAAFGPRRLWLHASDMGRPVYAAMGFETGGALPTYEFGT